MRDRGVGNVVAAAMAVFEKQENALNGVPFSATAPSEKKASSFIRMKAGDQDGAVIETRKRLPASSSKAAVAATKNKACLEDAHPTTTDARRDCEQKQCAPGRRRTDIECRNADDFESAIKNFDLIAEDVEKLVASRSCATKKPSPATASDCGVRNDHFAKAATEPAPGASDGFGNGSSDDSTSSSTETSDSESAGPEHVIQEGLETITEEERGNTESSASNHSSEVGDPSSPEDDSTLKENDDDALWSGSASNRDADSTSDVSSSSSGRTGNLRDSSMRCNSDFQWIRKDQQPKMDEPQPMAKPPINRPIRERTPRRDKTAPGSLDRRRIHYHSRQERDQKSKSTHVPKSSPRSDEFVPLQQCQNWCCNQHVPPEPICYENFHRRHERMDPQRYGSSPMLMEHHRYGDRGSHPDLYGDCGAVGAYRHDCQPVGCCPYHVTPPCCFYGDPRNYHWTPPSYTPKPFEGDERFRKIQGERDNLQLQVQVLSDQIEAQTDKIADLEKSLTDKKQMLVNAEDMLQREMLSRSSLETQKLELLSAISELKLQQAALERENLELRATHYNNNAGVDALKKPPLMPRMSPQPQLTSTPVHHHAGGNQVINMRMSPSPSPVTTALAGNSPRRIEATTPLQQEAQPPKTPPSTYRRQIDLHYGSLPRQQFISNGTNVSPGIDSNANPSANGSRKGVVFAETEKIVIEDSSTDSQQSPSLQFNKNKGIKKILGRMKRSGSGNLEDLPGIGEFQRGGVRATAAARLGWSEPQLSKMPDKPFAEWDVDNVCDWLTDLGFDQYVPEAKKWVKTGQQLQEASMNEIEKELGIKNLLHRKKLQLAIIDTQQNGSSDPFLSKAGQLDTSWVLRWLDDTGLPQHKESFLMNRIDGRVLHRLTMDDLAMLHVSSLLHVASLKRGIQVLRENHYAPDCLIRRSLPEDPPQPDPKQISLWTTHRVMEWLRAVDLAEYAPNLRGAGVHGGLMVLENKFTAELLASLLSIPPGKTLLRRHLNTHFKELLGKDIIQEKREAEATLGYIPLTPSAKMKIAKKSQFSLKRKKSKGEADYGDLVCPMNPSQSGELNNGSAISNSVGTMRTDEAREEDACRLVEMATRSLPQSLENSPVPRRH